MIRIINIVMAAVLALSLGLPRLAASQVSDEPTDESAMQSSDADEQADDEGDDEEEAEESAQLGTIQVTARRREEALQDVPMSVTAFSGEELQDAGAEDLTYLNQTVPNATIETTRGTNSTLSAFIRGVGQQDPVAGFESGVGIYLDGVYLNRPQGALLEVYDVQQIEVLRGPQGTLYGRNTIGGAVKYVTKRLGREPSASVRASIGSYSQVDVVARGELPLSDTFAVGASVASFQREGFGKNIRTGREHYDKDVVSFRGSAEWTPSSNFFLRLSGDYTDNDSNPKAGHREIPGLLSGAPVLGDVFDTRYGIQGDNEVEQYGGAMHIEYDMNPNWMLKSITAYREDETIQFIDFEALPAEDLDVYTIYDNDQFSQELQLNYSGNGVDGLLGFYYLDANAFNPFDVILKPTGDVLEIPGLNAFSLSDVETQSWSVFGDVTLSLDEFFDLRHGLELSLGGRYTSDERSSRVLRQTRTGGNSSFFGGDAVPIATSSDFSGSETFEDFTPRVSLAWQPSLNHTLYGSFSEGFKGGGFDPRGATTAAPDFNGDGTVSEEEVFEFMKFEPEQVDAFEAGAKSVFADGRLTTNLALFYNDYTDIQIPGSVGVDADGDGVAETFAGVTTNAGAATMQGVEFEGSALLGNDVFTAGDSFTAKWAVGYIDAEFDEFITQVTDPATGSTALEDVADERVIQNTPEWTSNLQLQYERQMSLFGAPGYFSIIGAWSYRSLTHQFETPSQFLDQPEYSLLDLNLVWRSLDDKYQVSIHGRNLTDKEYITSGYNFVTPDGMTPTLGLEGVANTFFGDPRTITGTFRINFR